MSYKIEIAALKRTTILLSPPRIFVRLSDSLLQQLSEPVRSRLACAHFTLHTFFAPGNFVRVHAFFVVPPLVKVRLSIVASLATSAVKNGQRFQSITTVHTFFVV